MKKEIILILCLVTGLILSACGSNSTDDRVSDLDEITELQEQPSEIRSENTKSETTKTEDQAVAAPTTGDETKKLEASVSDEEIFMQFISGEISAIIETDFESDLSYAGVIYDYSSDSKTYTFDTTGMTSLDQLISSIIDDAEFPVSDNNAKTYYAVTNTLSGKPVLAVKLENLGIYSPDDDSYALFIFAVNDGQLYMTYAYDSWARSWVSICDNMILSGRGSGGAGDGFDWLYYIDETGHCQSLYEMETLMGEWVAMYGYYDLDMEGSSSWSNGCEVCLLTTPHGSYYAYAADDTVDKEQLNIFTSSLEAKGMTQADDVGDVVDAIYEANNIPDNLSYFEGWIQYE